jgi:hypothetical protein
MFEAKILQGAILKKIIEAIRELVTDANLDCNERGITMQVRCRATRSGVSAVEHCLTGAWVCCVCRCA